MVALAAAAGVVIENARLYEEAARARPGWRPRPRSSLSSPAATGRLRSRPSRIVHARSPSRCGLIVSGRDSSELAQVVSGRAAIRRAAPCASTGHSRARSSGPASRSVVEDRGTIRERTTHRGDRWPILGPARGAAGGTRGVGGPGPGMDTGPCRRLPGDRRPAPGELRRQAALALQIARSREDQERLAVFEDRDRIARDLHDLVIQRLFAVGLGSRAPHAARTAPSRGAAGAGGRRPGCDGQGPPPVDFALGATASTPRTSRPRSPGWSNGGVHSKFWMLIFDGPVRTLIESCGGNRTCWRCRPNL